MTVAGNEAYEMLMSVRFLFLVVAYGGTGALVGYVWTSLDKKGALATVTKDIANAPDEQKAEVLDKIKEEGFAFSDMLGAIWLNPELPPLVVTVLLITSWLLPMLILLVG